MKKFIGIKEVEAKPMTLGEYNAYRGWEMHKDQDANTPGYLVEYMLVEGVAPNKTHYNHDNYISWSPKDVFEASYKEMDRTTLSGTGEKTLGNTTASQAKDNVKDIVFWGNGDLFKLLSKASSKKEGWMKSTKAMEIEGVGCVVQVTTQQGDNVAEAVTFVPEVCIREVKDENGTVISRQLVSIHKRGSLKL